MYNYPNICKILCLLFVFFFFWGCGGDSSKPPPKSKVVRGKITARPPDSVTDQGTSEPGKEGQEPGKEKKTDKMLADSEKSKGDEPRQPAKSSEKDEPKDDLLASISEIESKQGASDQYAAYDPKGIVDPFAPLFKDEPDKKEKPGPKPDEEDSETQEVRAPLTPLEKLDLGQLKLVGIIRSESGNKAMVEEASGKGYIIVKGTYIGIHSGKVVDILADRVIIEEEDKDAFGKIIPLKRELKFNRPSGDEYYEM
jgi:type IV pilus assembly protein PilP